MSDLSKAHFKHHGTLRSRKFPDALITDPTEAARQALQIVKRGSVIACDGSKLAVHAETLCVHGDSPGAAGIAAEVVRALRGAGVKMRAIKE